MNALKYFLKDEDLIKEEKEIIKRVGPGIIYLTNVTKVSKF